MIHSQLNSFLPQIHRSNSPECVPSTAFATLTNYGRISQKNIAPFVSFKGSVI